MRDKATSMRDLEAIANNAMQTVKTMLQYGELDEKGALDEIQYMCSREMPQVSSLHKTDAITLKAVAKLLTNLAEENGNVQ